MPTGLTDPLTATDFSAMTLDELCERHRELLVRTRDVDHWLRLINARLDLAVAAVADLPEPAPQPAPLIPAVTAGLGGPGPIRRAITATAGGFGLPPLPDASFDGAPLNGGHFGQDLMPFGDGPDMGAIPTAAPPEGLRDLLGIPRCDARRAETALLPQLREAKDQLWAYGEALRALTEEAAHLIAIRIGAEQLPA